MADTTLLQDMTGTFAGVIDVDGNIDTAKFCLAVRNLVTLLGKFGLAFSFVASDISNNCTKVETYQKSKPGEATATVQDLINSDIADNKAATTQGIIWLTRGLRFLAVALTRLINTPGLQVNPAFTQAYEETLKAHHGLAARLLVKGAFSAVLNRESFISLIAKNNANLESEVPGQLNEWLKDLEIVTRQLTTFIYTKIDEPAVKKLKELREEDSKLPQILPSALVE